MRVMSQIFCFFNLFSKIEFVSYFLVFSMNFQYSLIQFANLFYMEAMFPMIKNPILTKLLT